MSIVTIYFVIGILWSIVCMYAMIKHDDISDMMSNTSMDPNDPNQRNLMIIAMALLYVLAWPVLVLVALYTWFTTEN